MMADARIGADALAHASMSALSFSARLAISFEGDLGGQHGVGGVLGQLGAALIHLDDAIVTGG